MNRIIYLFCLIIVWNTQLQAQTFEVHESESYRVPGSFKSLGMHDGQEWSFEPKGRIGGDLIASDFKGKELKRIALETTMPGESFGCEGAWLFENQVKIFGFVSDDSEHKYEYYYASFSLDGKQSKDWEHIVTLDVPKNDWVETSLKLADDKSGVVVAALRPIRKQGKMVYQMMSFSFKSNKIFTAEVELSIKDKDLIAFHFNAMSTTKVVITEHGDSHPDKSEKIAQKQDPEWHQMMVVNMESQAIEKYGFSVPDKLILDAVGIEVPGGFAVAGLYAKELKRKKADSDGSFFMLLKDGKWNEAKTYDWNTDFRIQALGEKKAGKGKAIEGHFRVRDVKNIPGNKVALFGEGYNEISSTGPTTYYTDGILCAAFDYSGNQSWTRFIQNKREWEGERKYLSFNVVVTNKYVHVLFLDQTENWGKSGRSDEAYSSNHIWKSILTAASFNESGECTFIIANDTRANNLLLDPAQLLAGPDGSIVLYGRRKNKNAFGRVYFKD